MNRRATFATIAAAALVGTALVAAARAQGDKHDRTEIVRIPLQSVFHPAGGLEARFERAIYFASAGVNTQTTRVPFDIPLGATILEVGVVGQTSNQLWFRLERMDWAPVYEGNEPAPKSSGQWTCLDIVEHSVTRKTARPVPDDEQVPSPKREKESQEFQLAITLARHPSQPDEQKRAPVSEQKDFVSAAWVKISR